MRLRANIGLYELVEVIILKSPKQQYAKEEGPKADNHRLGQQRTPQRGLAGAEYLLRVDVANAHGRKCRAEVGIIDRGDQQDNDSDGEDQEHGRRACTGRWVEQERLEGVDVGQGDRYHLHLAVLFLEIQEILVVFRKGVDQYLRVRRIALVKADIKGEVC